MKQALEQERITPDLPEANLWRALIGQAIDDLSQPALQRAAVNWLTWTALLLGLILSVALISSPRDSHWVVRVQARIKLRRRGLKSSGLT